MGKLRLQHELHFKREGHCITYSLPRYQLSGEWYGTLKDLKEHIKKFIERQNLHRGSGYIAKPII